jgi:hypothetical protein
VRGIPAGTMTPDTEKVIELLTHELKRLKQELESPRLSAMRSTLGLAVPRAALRSYGSGTTGEAPRCIEMVAKEFDEKRAEALRRAERWLSKDIYNSSGSSHRVPPAA